MKHTLRLTEVRRGKRLARPPVTAVRPGRGAFSGRSLLYFLTSGESLLKYGECYQSDQRNMHIHQTKYLTGFMVFEARWEGECVFIVLLCFFLPFFLQIKV